MSPLRALPGRRESLAPAALLALLLIAVYAEPLFFRRNFGGRDLLDYNLPMEKAIHDAYGRGRLPAWSADISGGRPLLPNPNAGALYPLRVLLSATPFPVAIRVFPVLHWALSGIGMLLLLRSIGGSGAAAWLGAITYVFSGVGVGEVFFPHTHPGVTLLPWILWALHRLDAARPRGILLLSLLLGLDLLAGDVFTIALALVSCALWIVLERERGSRERLFLSLTFSMLLAGLLALPQIVATALWIPQTSRAVQGIKLWEAFFFSIPPVRLLELAVPYPFGPTWALDPSLVWAPAVFHGKSLGIFPTLYSGGFALAAVVFAWRARVSGVRFAFALIALGLIFSVAPSFLPASWGDAPSPVALRNPEKMSVALAFALSLLAGLAFDLRTRRSGGARWMIGVGAAFALLAAAAALFPHESRALAGTAAVGREVLARAAAAELRGSMAEAGLLWMAGVLAVDLLARGTSGARAGSLLLLTAVPILANRRIAQTFREDELLQPTAFARSLRRADPSGEYRTLGESLYRASSSIAQARSGSDRGQTEFARSDWVRFTQSLWGRGTVFNADFDAGDLSRVESLRRLSGLLSETPVSATLFGSLALRWGIRYRDEAPLPGYRRFAGDAVQDWDELQPALPDVRLVERWREEPDAVAALEALRHLAPGEVVIESGGRAPGTAPPGRVRLLEKSPERLLLETESKTPGWLFVLRAHWSHREVRLDGREVFPSPAQLAFSALPVPTGRHRLEWREKVPGGELSAAGPLLYGIAAAGLLLRSRHAPIRAGDPPA